MITLFEPFILCPSTVQEELANKSHDRQPITFQVRVSNNMMMSAKSAKSLQLASGFPASLGAEVRFVRTLIPRYSVFGKICWKWTEKESP